MTIRLSMIFVVLSAMAASAMAQDTAKSKVVQEDPILTEVQPRDRDDDDAMTLPSDPENAIDNKVQEDPLLRPVQTDADNAGEASRAVDKAMPAPQQDSVSEPRAKVQEDPMLDLPPSVLLQKPTPRDDNRMGMPAKVELEADKETRLVPKPKDNAVQEDPLLRTGIPL